MVRPKDARVWNEDLVRACSSRYEMCEQQGKKQQYLWREGAEKIQAVRGDIYAFSTGRVVNLPQNLSKTVHTLCMDIIQGRKNVLPDGYGAVSQAEAPQGNRFERHPYLKQIKMRGGAYAILMAFHHSQTKTLNKEQICRAAQPYCDEDMRENYHAGRMYGAFASKKTLVKHSLLTENGGRARYVDGVGFRANGCATFTLTRDGEQFIEAMLRKFPQGAPASSADVKPSWPSSPGPFSSRAGPFRTPNRATSSSAKRGGKLESGDEEKLREWVLTAQVNDTIDFKVGKSRRKHLHDLCDALEREFPGLLLDHRSSNETTTRRTLTITVEARPNGGNMSAKRRLFDSLAGQSSQDSAASSPAKRVRSNLPPKVAAAQAALERQAIQESLQDSGYKPVPTGNVSYEEMERRAIAESLRTAPKHATSPDSVDSALDQKLDVLDYEELERRAILESLESAKKPVSSPDSEEDELNAAIQLSLVSAKRASADLDDESADGSTFQDKKLPARSVKGSKQRVSPQRQLFKSDVEAIELLSDEDDEFVASVANSRREAIVIDLGDESDAPPTKSDDVIEIEDSQDSAAFLDETRNDESRHSIIVLDESHDTSIAASPSPREGRLGQGSNDPLHLYVIIDNRERNRNATPRHLRMELTNLVTTGALQAVWPRRMPAGRVEEMQLEIGDFAFDIKSHGSDRKRIAIAVERKRVSDLVQRSVAGDHWRQFLRMRDECSHSIFLLENDTRMATRFTAFGSQELDGWKPNGTLIDDERSIFLFFGRAVLSSRTTRFIQTRDEISSLRAVGALGIMATCCEDVRRRAVRATPPSSNEESRLADRLMAGGIPWQLAREMGKSLGSVRYLEHLYEECASDECKSCLLVPFIPETDYSGLQSTTAGWSEAIYRVFRSSQTECLLARRQFDEKKRTVSDHGKLLSKLHRADAQDEPTDDSYKTSGSLAQAHSERRVVTIEVSKEKSTLFPPQTADSFYSLNISAKNPMQLALPTVIMRTTCGKRVSRRLFVHLLQAKSMVSLVTSRIAGCSGDFVAAAKDVATSICRDCNHRSMKSGKDRRVLLLCGLTPALDAVAKKADYRQETRAVVDLVLAQLMLDGLAVIQAVRLSGDTELILQQLALACYHYHLLFEDSNQAA